MEVFSKYFRRLLTGNAPQIFPGVNKPVENAGNYPLLVQELQKVSTDMDQSQKIAETVDTSEGDIFRDFDLSTFLDHFRLDPIVKVSLALAFKLTSKSDLRAKGMCFSHCVWVISNHFHKPMLYSRIPLPLSCRAWLVRPK